MHAWTHSQTHTHFHFLWFLSSWVAQYLQHVNKSLLTTCSAVNSWSGALWWEADISCGFSTEQLQVQPESSEKEKNMSAAHITSHCTPGCFDTTAVDREVRTLMQTWTIELVQYSEHKATLLTMAGGRRGWSHKLTGQAQARMLASKTQSKEKGQKKKL